MTCWVDERRKRSRRGPCGAMIDWTAVFATLPDQFTLDTLDAHKAANEKPRVCLRGGHTLVEGGSDQAYRSGHVPEDLIQKKLDGTDGAEVSPVQWKCLKTNKGQPP